LPIYSNKKLWLANKIIYLLNEAIRVLNMMPQWQPAQQHGRLVRSRYKIPFMLRLK
jgi:hypothetical protein